MTHGADDPPLVAALLPEGLDPPRHVPPAIFRMALDTFLSGRRLDMKEMAAELGMSRATLYRKAPARDPLLGEVLWYLARFALERALQATERRRGARRVVAVTERFMRDVIAQPALRRFLDAEPEIALRILTSKVGPVQGGTVRAVAALLAEERANGHFDAAVDDRLLAYAIVRIGEGFLYADVIADGEPDVDLAIDVISHLLHVRRGPLPPPED